MLLDIRAETLHCMSLLKQGGRDDSKVLRSACGVAGRILVSRFHTAFLHSKMEFPWREFLVFGGESQFGGFWSVFGAFYSKRRAFYPKRRAFCSKHRGICSVCRAFSSARRGLGSVFRVFCSVFGVFWWKRRVLGPAFGVNCL